MSLPLEQLKDQNLKRLDIPDKTVESPQGLNTLYLQKVLNLTYQVNNIWTIPHKTDIRTASDITASGASFTAPIDKRRLIFSMRITFVTTATVGNRVTKIRRNDKPGNVITGFMDRTIAASQTETYTFGPSSASDSTLTFNLSYPIVLEPEWVILVDDTSNVDNLDDVAWNIEYLEIPI